MTPDELFRVLSLDSINISALQAQMTQGVNARETECNAHVEFQLTPSAVENTSPAQFALQIRLTCSGTPLRGNTKSRLFDLEIKALAVYRQSTAESVSLSDFSANHTVFARQVFPVLSSRAQSLLEQLGLNNIRLPVDLPHDLSNSGQSATPVVLN